MQVTFDPEIEQEEGMEDQDERKVACEVYSRIVGYLRPIQNWNKGKLQEFKDRKTYSLAAAQQHA
jgi:anaerobic ribonucleoside-triphosphate reductase